MWAKVNAQTVAQENTVNLMQIDMMQLNVLMTQLDNVSMQAILIIGFALGMWGGETLDPLTDDTGSHCIFKAGPRKLCAMLFFASVGLCITNCFIAVAIAAYVKQAAQAAALLISPQASVANTRRHMHFIYSCFICAIAFFFVSAMLLVWLFVGLPARIPFDPSSDADESRAPWDDDDGVTEMYDGMHTITCIDRFSPTANRERNDLSFLIATVNSCILLGMALWGYWRFHIVRKSYGVTELLTWWGEYKVELAREHAAIRNQRNDHSKKAGKTKGEYRPPPVPSSAFDSTFHVYNSDVDSTDEQE